MVAAGELCCLSDNSGYIKGCNSAVIKTCYYAASFSQILCCATLQMLCFVLADLILLNKIVLDKSLNRSTNTGDTFLFRPKITCNTLKLTNKYLHLSKLTNRYLQLTKNKSMQK